jgi:hypothetical protein
MPENEDQTAVRQRVVRLPDGSEITGNRPIVIVGPNGSGSLAAHVRSQAM